MGRGEFLIQKLPNPWQDREDHETPQSITTHQRAALIVLAKGSEFIRRDNHE